MAKVGEERVNTQGEETIEQLEKEEKLMVACEEDDYVSELGHNCKDLTKLREYYPKKISLGIDYYSLTWIAIEKKTFNNMYIRGQKIDLLPQDYFSLYFYFLVFISALGITIILLIKEALLDDVYVEGSYQIILLRMLLVIFTQMNTGEEIELAYAKFLYPLINRGKFHHPAFASFIGFCHLLMCVTSIIGLIFFICMADEFADPVINFAGITVLIELDNWVGDAIKSMDIQQDDLDILVRDDDEDKTEENNEDNRSMIAKAIKSRGKFKLKYLNENLSFKHKLALIQENQLEITIDETINHHAPWYIVILEKLFTLIPWWIVLPLSTYPLSIMLPTITDHLRNYLGYEI
jgi:hypothetical protein